MKKGLTLLVQIIIVLIGVATLAFMLWEPHLEGRNISASFFEIYFNDPFLAWAYTGSIPFFVALCQAFKIAGNKESREATAKSLRTIQRCAQIIIGFVVFGTAYLVIAVRGQDDITGGIFMALLVIAGAGLAEIGAKRFAQKLTR